MLMSAIKEEDKVILGQINPKWISSMRHSVTYKNLDFSLMLNAKWGYLIHPGHLQWLNLG